jgi:hypothetical protein
MLGGDWEEVTGACICPLVEFIFLCFFLVGVLPSVAAFAGTIMGAASDVMANTVSVTSRMASLVMRFSFLIGRRDSRSLMVLPHVAANIPSLSRQREDRPDGPIG